MIEVWVGGERWSLPVCLAHLDVFRSTIAPWWDSDRLAAPATDAASA